ncbi:hypothetical protein [Ornithinimicrobium cavernae]|uniref:hypothetical protein n=1 Tax=Ornithinimicrobium cavernae TaxID=2666047 RepID=UPI000D69D558|nr:hypothetical protein [Ornithinimicrobium cavernae]
MRAAPPPGTVRTLRASLSAGRGRVATVLGRTGGSLLAFLFGTVARARGTRALHPVGFCGEGLLSTTPGPSGGVVLLEPATPHPCHVRWSRATGLRRGPDVEGLAVRVSGPGAGDVLLASTGTGPITRHLLTIRRPRRHGPLTTLLPLRTMRGNLLLRLDPLPPRGAGAAPPTAYRLFIAAPGQPWHERGRLEVTWSGRDCSRRHDPVGHPPAGAWTHPLWARLRDPSYAASQQVPADGGS